MDLSILAGAPRAGLEEEPAAGSWSSSGTWLGPLGVALSQGAFSRFPVCTELCCHSMSQGCGAGLSLLPCARLFIAQEKRICCALQGFSSTGQCSVQLRGQLS